MRDGMSGLDNYLTQSDDSLRDPRITDDKVRADALGDLDLDENYQIHVGSADYMEVVGQIASVTASEDGIYWYVDLHELEFPVRIPNDPTVWIDFA